MYPEPEDKQVSYIYPTAPTCGRTLSRLSRLKICLKG
jgi:hypothetical protein